VKTYRHTQPGTVIRVAVGIMAAILAAVALKTGLPALVGFVILLILAWLFHSLTIEIGDGELSWRFGPGLIRRRVRLDDIASVKVVRTSFLEGWGIHYSRFGWLYNVSGFGAVAIQLNSGKRFCLGSDEPEELAVALQPPGSSPA